MSTFWLLWIAGLAVAGIPLNIVLLRLACVVWRVPDATWWRVTRVLLMIALVLFLGLGVVYGLLALNLGQRDSGPGVVEFASLAMLALVGLVAPLGALSWGLKISLAKSLGIWATIAAGGVMTACFAAMVLAIAAGQPFVIPTGAMAPTVIGQHIHVRCPNCAHEMNVGVSEATLMMHGWDEIEQRGYDCQQCGERDIPLNRKLLSGDRVYVDKTQRHLRRFDIAVFHVRAEQLSAVLPNAQDLKYIMRCVGLPGEEVAIFDGDLFIDGQRLQKGPHEVEDLWIAVHDTDLRPRQTLPDGPTWRGVEKFFNGWKSQNGQWQIRSDADLAQLQFDGPLTDRYAYEPPLDAQSGRRPSVRDWRITVDLAEFAGDGALGFFWQHGERATCLAAMPHRAVQVFRDPDHFASEKDAAGDDQDKGKQVPRSVSQLTFAVRDGKAYLSIDGELRATADLAPSGIDKARAAYGDDELAPPPPPRFGIVARRCNATIRRIQLHRDVYYRTRQEMEPSFGDRSADAWQLEREYFFLGDQSPQSQDCRYLGPIHEREIIGIARWCYWPPERAREFPRP